MEGCEICEMLLTTAASIYVASIYVSCNVHIIYKDEGVHPPIILPPPLPPPPASFIKLSVGYAIYSIAWQVAADVGGGGGGKDDGTVGRLMLRFFVF